MTEVIYDELLPSWLNTGMSYNDFWEYDFQEIKLILESWYNNKKQDMKDQLSYIYLNAQLVAQFVGCSISGSKPPKIEDLFPNLFEGEEHKTDTTNAQIDMFKAFADAFNSKRATQQPDAIYVSDVPLEEEN